MNKRYKLFKAAVASKCPKLWQEYKKARNEVTGALRQAKASYFREAFQEIKETCTFWNMVNKATNSTTRKCIGPLKWVDGSLALADDEKACLMNSYFATIGEKTNWRTSVHLEGQLPVQTERRKDNDRTPSAWRIHNFSATLNSNES